MAVDSSAAGPLPRRRLLSLDGWAVVLALALAAAVRTGLLPSVKW